jgi:hypothetical protein
MSSFNSSIPRLDSALGHLQEIIVGRMRRWHSLGFYRTLSAGPFMMVLLFPKIGCYSKVLD